MKIRFVDPIRSLKTRQRRPRGLATSKRPTGIKNNPHGIGAPLMGESARNPEGKGGFGDNPSDKALLARLRGGFKAKNNINPLGCAGYKSIGAKKVEKKSNRTEEGVSIVKEAREIQELARKHVPDALQALADIIASETSSDMAKIAAYHALADRGYGKPTQTNINANIDADAKPQALDDDALNKRIAETLKRIEGLESAPVRTRETLDSETGPSDIRKLN